MGTNSSGVVEFNFAVAEEGLARYKQLYANVQGAIEELSAEMQSKPDQWTGDTEIVAKELIRDSHYKAQLMQGNIAVVNNAIAEARTAFIANDNRNNQVLVNAKR